MTRPVPLALSGITRRHLRRFGGVALLAASSFACGAGGFGTPQERAVAAEAQESGENLKGTLWTQTSIERRAVCLQAYEIATLRLDEALRDRSWTASAEQAAIDPAKWRDLPPALLIDVDETALDNSPYEARRIRDGLGHSPERFEAWVREGKATALPGAVEFTKEARAKGVAVLYLTNRSIEMEPPTRANLESVGFPLDSGDDAVVSRGELDESGAADKGERRKQLAAKYRIVLLVGDDLGDFLANPRTKLEERERMVAAYSEWWGRRWIVLPNPSYGSWEDSLLGADRVAAADVRRKKKLAALRTADGK